MLMSPIVTSNITDSQTKRIIRSLLAKYMRRARLGPEDVIMDPSGAANWVSGNLISKHIIEMPDLKLKIVHMLAEEELNL